jgi:hypothetical protein
MSFPNRNKFLNGIVYQRSLMKKIFSLILVVSSLTGCGLFSNPAVLDPLVAACAQDLSQWSVVIDAAKTMNLTPMQLATAMCEIPIVIAPYAQKQTNAKDIAEKAYLDLKVGNIKSVETSTAVDAGVAK